MPLCSCGSKIIKGSSFETKDSNLHFEECPKCKETIAKKRPLSWKNMRNAQRKKHTLLDILIEAYSKAMSSEKTPVNQTD